MQTVTVALLFRLEEQCALPYHFLARISYKKPVGSECAKCIMLSKFRIVVFAALVLVVLGAIVAITRSTLQERVIVINSPHGYQMQATPGLDSAISSWHLTKTSGDLTVGITLERNDTGLIYHLVQGLNNSDDPLGGHRAAARNQKKKNPANMTINKDAEYTVHGIRIRGFDTQEVRANSFVVKRFGAFYLRGHAYTASGMFRFRRKRKGAVEQSNAEWRKVLSSIR